MGFAKIFSFLTLIGTFLYGQRYSIYTFAEEIAVIIIRGKSIYILNIDWWHCTTSIRAWEFYRGQEQDNWALASWKKMRCIYLGRFSSGPAFSPWIGKSEIFTRLSSWQQIVLIKYRAWKWHWYFRLRPVAFALAFWKLNSSSLFIWQHYSIIIWGSWIFLYIKVGEFL